MSPSLALPAASPDEAQLVAALTSAGPAHMALAVRMLGNPEDARDALQEARFRAWRHLGSVRSTEALHGWLRAVVARECLRSLRRNAVRRWLPFGPPQVEPVDPASGPERDVAAAEVRRRLDRALIRLPPRQRLVWGLRFDEGWSVAEIAAATEIRPDTVKTHLDRALSTLQRHLGGIDVL